MSVLAWHGRKSDDLLEDVDGKFYNGMVEIYGDFYIGVVEILEEVDSEFYSGMVEILEMDGELYSGMLESLKTYYRKRRGSRTNMYLKWKSLRTCCMLFKDMTDRIQSFC